MMSNPRIELGFPRVIFLVSKFRLIPAAILAVYLDTSRYINFEDNGWEGSAVLRPPDCTSCIAGVVV